jgi:6-phosphogluconolactonase (cycloisomerase 2 family)
VATTCPRTVYIGTYLPQYWEAIAATTAESETLYKGATDKKLRYDAANPARGIYRCVFDTATGMLSDATLVVKTAVSPAWLRWHPTLPVLYVAMETAGTEGPSNITAFRLTDAEKPAGNWLHGSGRMSSVTTAGASGCHFSLHPSARWLACANHGLHPGSAVNAGTISGAVFHRSILIKIPWSRF